MEHRFFISHYSGDKHIAELFSNTLRRVSLEQIQPWFSSDSDSGRGLQPGDIWFSKILKQISESKAVVALLTPNSINKPWLFFECGIGQAIDNCEVISICIGLNREDVLPPLGLYQCYQLSDYRSVIEFFSKLLALFKIKFDEEMSAVVTQKFVSEVSKIKFDNKIKEETYTFNIETIIDNFKSHIDMRFIEVLQNQRRGEEVKNYINISNDERNSTSYPITFSVCFPEFNNSIHIEIRDNDSFQSIANAIYNNISDYVHIWTYLDEWVIVERGTNVHVVIREVGDWIPAKCIFKPNSKWDIIKLKTPYKISDSQERFPRF